MEAVDVAAKILGSVVPKARSTWLDKIPESDRVAVLELRRLYHENGNSESLSLVYEAARQELSVPISEGSFRRWMREVQPKGS